MKYTYVGKIYEGRWKVVDLDRKLHRYILKNIYNGKIISVHYATIRAVENGKMTISYHMFRKIKKERKEKYEIH